MHHVQVYFFARKLQVLICRKQLTKLCAHSGLSHRCAKKPCKTLTIRRSKFVAPMQVDVSANIYCILVAWMSHRHCYLGSRLEHLYCHLKTSWFATGNQSRASKLLRDEGLPWMMSHTELCDQIDSFCPDPGCLSYRTCMWFVGSFPSGFEWTGAAQKFGCCKDCNDGWSVPPTEAYCEQHVVNVQERCGDCGDFHHIDKYQECEDCEEMLCSQCYDKHKCKIICRQCDTILLRDTNVHTCEDCEEVFCLDCLNSHATTCNA